VFARYADSQHSDLCAAGLLVSLPDGSCDPLHPSGTGHRLVALTVLASAMIVPTVRPMDR
jgi:hypothetical protein